MKKMLLPLAVAAFCGLPVASALNADMANVSLDVGGSSDLKVEMMSPSSNGYFNAKDAKGKGSDKLSSWQYICIPLKVDGKCRGDKNPNFVGELKVHVYAAFDGGKDADPVLLDKEITYVEIPLTGKASENKDWMEGSMNAGVFLSPANASKILGNDKEKIDLKDKLIGVAVEATFNDADCMHPKKDPYCVVDAKYKQKLSDKWWKKGSANKYKAELLAISETPFAPFYAPTFPATKPLYGSAYSSLSPSSSTLPAADDSTTAADTTVKPADTTTTDTAAPEKKKSKKKAK